MAKTYINYTCSETQMVQINLQHQLFNGTLTTKAVGYQTLLNRSHMAQIQQIITSINKQVSSLLTVLISIDAQKVLHMLYTCKRKDTETIGMMLMMKKICMDQSLDQLQIFLLLLQRKRLRMMYYTYMLNHSFGK